LALLADVASPRRRVIPAALKGATRICEKVAMRGEIPWDVVRAQIVVMSMKDLADVLEELLSREDFAVAEANDRFASPKNGWADVSLYLTFPAFPGVVAELQLVHHALLFVREDLRAHAAYDGARFSAEILRLRHDKVLAGLPWSQHTSAMELLQKARR